MDFRNVKLFPIVFVMIVLLGAWGIAQQVGGGPLPIQAMAYWGLNETTGNFTDIRGGFDGEIIRNSTWIADVTRGQSSLNSEFNASVEFAGGVGAGNAINLTRKGLFLQEANLGFENWSLNVWVLSDNNNDGDRFFASNPNQLPNIELLEGGGGKWSMNLKDDNSVTYSLETGTQATNTWTMITATGNTTTLRIYVNATNYTQVTGGDYRFTNHSFWLGTQQAGGASSDDWDGKIDEVSFYNFTLTPSQIATLYDPSLSVFLTAPSNATNNSQGNVLFNATIDATDTDTLKNASLIIWNTNHSILNRTSTTLSGTNATFGVRVRTLQPDVYVWNYEGCGQSAGCTYASTNNTLRVQPENITSYEFDTPVTSGSTERYELNVTIPIVSALTSANLFYNNTFYAGTFTQIAQNNYSLATNLVVPSTSQAANISFWWDLRFTNGFNYNTTSINQSIQSILLDDCSSYSVLVLNYTLRDEENRSHLGGTPYNTSIEVDLDISPVGNDGSNPVIEFNHTYTKVNPAQVCVNGDVLNNTNFRLDSTARYSSLNRVVEFHNIQNFSLSNETIPQNIDLYDLLATDSQEFLITFKDTSFLPVRDALIDVTRRYVGEGVFRSVEIPKTNPDGQALTHLVLGDVVYTIIVKKENQILGTFDNIVPFCADLTAGDCQIVLNTFSSGIDLVDYDTSGNLTYVFDFDRDARTLQTTFTTLDGVSRIALNATLFDHLGNNTFCSQSVTTTSGSLTCNIPISIGNSTIVADLWNDNALVARAYFSLSQDPSELFGLSGTMMLILLYITIPLMLITTGVGVVIGAILGLIFGAILNLFVGGGIVGAGATILWFIIAGAIIIFKINSRRNT